jgi:sec-independent protein translocase protein TatA
MVLFGWHRRGRSIDTVVGRRSVPVTAVAEEDAVGSLSPMHWFLLILIVVLLFGSRKLPDAARAVGRSLRILKAETASLREDDDRREDAAHRDERRYREEHPRDAYPQDRSRDYRGYQDRDYRGYQDRDYRDRGGYQPATGDDRAPREHPMEPRAVEGPPMNPAAGGTRADSRTPDTQPR